MIERLSPGNLSTWGLKMMDPNVKMKLGVGMGFEKRRRAGALQSRAVVYCSRFKSEPSGTYLIKLSASLLSNSAKRPEFLGGFSLCYLCVLGASVVRSWAVFLTTESQRTPRSHREKGQVTSLLICSYPNGSNRPTLTFSQGAELDEHHPAARNSRG